MNKIIIIVTLYISVVGCGRTDVISEKDKQCIITLDGALGVNGVSFGDSIESVQRGIPGNWHQINIEKSKFASEVQKSYAGKEKSFYNYKNGGVGYNFVGNKLAAVYQEGGINVCSNGHHSGDMESLVSLLSGNGFRLLGRREVGTRTIAILENDTLTITVSEVPKGKGMNGVIIMVYDYFAAPVP